jgi:2-hydroxy-6-oxonona-2,4-dienedioate hydrolase
MRGAADWRFIMNGTPYFLWVVLIVLAAAGGFIFLSYQKEITRARAAAESGGRVVNTGMGPIEYAETGSGVVILLIHGAGGGYDLGIANVADLIGDRFRVIAPSRFGYLGTPLPEDASPSAQADALAALLTELEVDKAIVVGTSAGARSAIELSSRHPEKVSALFLIVPGTFAPDSPVKLEGSRGSLFAYWLANAGADFAWWAMEKVSPSVLIRFMGVPLDVFANAPAPEQDRVMNIVRSVQPLSRRVLGINVDCTTDPTRYPLEAIRAPTLVVSARDDLFNTLPAAQFAANNIPNAELVVYETGGHLLVGRENELRSAAETFLATAGLGVGAPNTPTLSSQRLRC